VRGVARAVHVRPCGGSVRAVHSVNKIYRIQNDHECRLGVLTFFNRGGIVRS
jgi:hypothetical protein